MTARAPRSQGTVRALRILLRTGHLLAFAVLYGRAWDGGPAAGPATAAALTGLALVSLEVAVSPVWLVQIRGLVTAAKAVLLVCGLAFPSVLLPSLTAAAIAGGISSHMPGRYRYYSVLHRQVRGDTSAG